MYVRICTYLFINRKAESKSSGGGERAAGSKGIYKYIYIYVCI
jgi:hypothetical protein